MVNIQPIKMVMTGDGKHEIVLLLTLKPPGRRELLPGGAPRSTAAASSPGLAGAADGRHGAADLFGTSVMGSTKLLIV